MVNIQFRADQGVQGVNHIHVDVFCEMEENLIVINISGVVEDICRITGRVPDKTKMKL